MKRFSAQIMLVTCALFGMQSLSHAGRASVHFRTINRDTQRSLDTDATVRYVEVPSGIERQAHSSYTFWSHAITIEFPGSGPVPLHLFLSASDPRGVGNAFGCVGSEVDAGQVMVRDGDLIDRAPFPMDCGAPVDRRITLTGTVTNQLGEPMEGARVELIQASNRYEGFVTFEFGPIMTDADGNFRWDGILPTVALETEGIVQFQVRKYEPDCLGLGDTGYVRIFDGVVLNRNVVANCR